MSTYAYVYENQIVEFKEIPDELYSSWVSDDNPKKDCYKIVQLTQSPAVSSSEVAEPSFEITPTAVVQIWTVRNKTPDELRKIWTAYEFLTKFTYTERAAYRNAAKTDDLVADFMGLAQAANEIISDNPVVIQGMDYLVSIGVLTQARRNEILEINS